MGKQYDEISKDHQGFIAQQKVFFCASAAPDGKVNLSPKGGDCLRVLGPNQVIWLNLTGSGNETAAHLRESNRMTIMFCAFEGAPKILRLYGSARVFHNGSEGFERFAGNFEARTGSRQIFEMQVDLVQTSCGFGVPFFDYQGERDALRKFEDNKGPDGIKEYWQVRNARSLDGKETGIDGG